MQTFYLKLSLLPELEGGLPIYRKGRDPSSPYGMWRREHEPEEVEAALRTAVQAADCPSDSQREGWRTKHIDEPRAG